jgi:hypothetical protein
LGKHKSDVHPDEASCFRARARSLLIYCCHLRHVAPFRFEIVLRLIALHAAIPLLLEHRWATPILLANNTTQGSTANDEIGTSVTDLLQPLPPIVARVLGHE